MNNCTDMWPSLKQEEEAKCSNPTGGGEVECWNSHDSETIANEIGRKLCQWFYFTLPKQLHQKHQPFNELASSYFTENVHLQCTYNIKGQNKLECTGLMLTTWVLSGIYKEENLLFSPNLDLGGLKTGHDRYGVLTVEISGTVHKDNSYIGIFDHTFKAVRLPGRKKFIIKSVQLNIHT
ncbi:uncharacterized protein C3orf38 homolog [Bufo gargarizans]|uniref:uncharacterized protein C3orf38 homolog n=1 Tax=Bufo gargarizans TaxID=30331 RepID=UPI001CF59CD8|nr:uncharacterized protein C3orf38 homolog [Bufo gargarizans]